MREFTGFNLVVSVKCFSVLVWKLRAFVKISFSFFFQPFRFQAGFCFQVLGISGLLRFIFDARTTLLGKLRRTISCFVISQLGFAASFLFHSALRSEEGFWRVILALLLFFLITTLSCSLADLQYRSQAKGQKKNENENFTCRRMI